MYDRVWAEGIYDEFYRHHIFACREMNRLYRISVDACVSAIQQGSERWRGYKALVKHADKSIHIYWNHYHTQEGVRRKYYTFDKYLKDQFQKRLFPAPIDLVDTNIELELEF